MKVTERPEAKPSDPAPHQSRRRLIRRLVIGLLTLAVIGIVLAALSLLPAMAARSQFDDGKTLLAQGQDALVRGDADAAADAFARARAAFQRAAEQPGMFLLRLERHVPLLGRTPDAIVALADIGERISVAGEEVSRGIQQLPGGLADLGLTDGRLPLDALASLSPSVRRAHEALEAAAGEADRLPDSWLLGPVADARDLVQLRVAEALPLARAADAMLRAMRQFAGADAPRRYFVAAQNSAELRGTGGLIGNYSILTIDKGRLSLGPFQDVQSLTNVPADQAPAPPSADFEDLYGPFGGGGFWLNINMTPDAPTAATVIESLYQQVTGTKVDGTIFVDLQGLTDLLDATGPVRVPELRTTLTAQTFLKFVATSAYLNSGIPDAFRAGPRLVAQAVWGRFLSGSDPEQALRTLVGAASGGHLILHSVDPSVESAFQQAGVAGQLAPEDGNAFGVVLSNAAANKVDYYLHERIRDDVSLEAGGVAQSNATIELANEAPSAPPQDPAGRYSLGPYPGLAVDGEPLVSGEDRSWMQIYCGSGCRLIRATSGGQPFGVEAHREQGLDVFANFVQVKPGETEQIGLATWQAGAWSGDVGGGSYALTVRGQPLIQPVGATVVIHAPPGMNVTWTSVPMQVQGGEAVWTGHLGISQKLQIRFRPPLAQRVWARVWHLVSTPVVHF